MRKVVDALPDEHQAAVDNAAQRLLVEPEVDLLSRRLVSEDIKVTVMREVRGAVLAGRKLRIHYAAPDTTPRWRTVDPIGLVTVRDRTYLLATTSGAYRTYRLSRMLVAEQLPEPAQRPSHVDLGRMWQERSARFLAEEQISVVVRVAPARRDELLATARAVRSEATVSDGWVRLELTFEDLRHAVWAVWQLSTDVDAIGPDSLRAALHDRASTIAERYAPTPRHSVPAVHRGVA